MRLSQGLGFISLDFMVTKSCCWLLAELFIYLGWRYKIAVAWVTVWETADTWNRPLDFTHPILATNGLGFSYHTFSIFLIWSVQESNQALYVYTKTKRVLHSVWQAVKICQNYFTPKFDQLLYVIGVSQGNVTLDHSISWQVIEFDILSFCHATKLYFESL